MMTMMKMSARVKSKKKESSRMKQIGGGGCDGGWWWLRWFRFESDNGTKPMMVRTTKARTKKVIGC